MGTKRAAHSRRNRSAPRGQPKDGVPKRAKSTSQAESVARPRLARTELRAQGQVPAPEPGETVLQAPSLTPNEQAALEELVWEMSKPHTLEDIATRLGVPLVTVFDIEKRALRKMRKRLIREGKSEWQGPLVEPDEDPIFPK